MDYVSTRNKERKVSAAYAIANGICAAELLIGVGLGRKVRQLLRREQPLAEERLQIDEIRVARVCRGGLVGRIAERRLIQRQNLPDVLPRFGEEIDEFVRFRPEIADTAAGGQRKYGQ